jgi:hypothetical protein
MAGDPGVLVNLVEVWFGIVKRRAIRCGVFKSASPGVASSLLAGHFNGQVWDDGPVEAEDHEPAMIAVVDCTCGGLGVREPAPRLPTAQLVEGLRTVRSRKRNRPTGADFLLEPLHRSSADAFALAIRTGSHGLVVSDGAPRLVSEPDPPRYGAGVPDEAAGVASEHVHAGVGVVRVVVAEAVAEGPVLQRSKCRAERPVDLVTIDYDGPTTANLWRSWTDAA